MTASDYDDFANAYSAENESNLFNAYYEGPAMLGLAGEVSGRRILDAGCGSGPLPDQRVEQHLDAYPWALSSRLHEETIGDR